MPPIKYLRLAEEYFPRGRSYPEDEAMLASLKDELEYARGGPGLLPQLLLSENWSDRVRAQGRKPRIMLDANCNQAETLQVGFSLLVDDPFGEKAVFIAEDYHEWVSKGLSAGWASGWERPKQEFAYFKHVGRFLRKFGEHDTDFHRYCLLAAIAEYERIRRVLAFDLDLIAAAEFHQSWTDGRLVEVKLMALRDALRAAHGQASN
jgi:hypothetical protein